MQANGLVLIDEPAPWIRRLTLNRPEKRNALNSAMRAGIIDALQEADNDPGVRVTIVRGAGTCFSSGYDLGESETERPTPWFSAPGEAHFQRDVTSGWMGIWDLAKPVIAQVHGYCLAGGSELATGCDLVFVAENAQIGYPPARYSVADMQFHAWFLGMRAAMMMMLTGAAISGTEAATRGWANEAVPETSLETRVLQIAADVARTPTDILSLNKRSVHHAMDSMGLRAAIRAGTELAALAQHQQTFREFTKSIEEVGVTEALTRRDRAYGDYRARPPAHDVDVEER